MWAEDIHNGGRLTAELNSWRNIFFFATSSPLPKSYVKTAQPNNSGPRCTQFSHSDSLVLLLWWIKSHHSTVWGLAHHQTHFTLQCCKCCVPPYMLVVTWPADLLWAGSMFSETLPVCVAFGFCDGRLTALVLQILSWFDPTDKRSRWIALALIYNTFYNISLSKRTMEIGSHGPQRVKCA